MRFTRYGPLDLAACLVWAVVVGLLGFGTGEALERLLGDLKRYEVVLLFVLTLAGLVYGLFLYLKERRLSRTSSIFHEDA